MVLAGFTAEPDERLGQAVLVGPAFRRQDLRAGFAARCGFDTEIDGGVFDGVAVCVDHLDHQWIAHDLVRHALPFGVFDLRADDHAHVDGLVRIVQRRDLDVVVTDLVPGADLCADHADDVGLRRQLRDFQIRSFVRLELHRFTGKKRQFAGGGLVVRHAAHLHADVPLEFLTRDRALVGAVDDVETTDLAGTFGGVVACGENRDQKE